MDLEPLFANETRAISPLNLPNCRFSQRAFTPPLENGLSQTASDDEVDAVSEAAFPAVDVSDRGAQGASR